MKVRPVGELISASTCHETRGREREDGELVTGGASGCAKVDRVGADLLVSLA